MSGSGPHKIPVVFYRTHGGTEVVGTGCGVWTTSTAKSWASTSCAFNTAGR